MSPEPPVLGEEPPEIEGMGVAGKLVSRRKMCMPDDLVGETHPQERLRAEAMGGGDHTLETVSLCVLSRD